MTSQSSPSLRRNSDFVKLWGAETFSQIGSQVSFIALPLVAISLLGASAAELGFLTTAQFLPIILVSQVAGHWLDAHDIKLAMVIINLARAAVIATIPVAYFVGLLSIPLLLVVAFVTGCLASAYDVAYMSYFPRLVHKDQLTQAGARVEMTYSMAEAAGPGLGGVLVQSLTAPVAIVVDAVSYLITALTTHSIRHEEDTPTGDSGTMMAGIRRGLNLVVGNRNLVLTAAQSAIFNMLAPVTFTLYFLYGINDLRLSESLLGLVLSLGAIGTILGSLAAESAATRLGFGRTMVWSMFVGSSGLFVIPAVGRGIWAVPILVAGMALHGFGIGMFNVLSLSMRNTSIPADELGRATGAWRMLTNGTLPLSGLLTALLGTVFGARAAMVIAVAALTLMSLAYVASPVRNYVRPSDIVNKRKDLGSSSCG